MMSQEELRGEEALSEVERALRELGVKGRTR
jgi:hypothetical protein